MAPGEEAGLPGHEVRRGGGEVDHQRPDLVETSGAAGRHVAEEPLPDAGIAEGDRVHVGHEPAGRDRVDLDRVAGPLHGESPRETRDPTLGCRVDTVAGQAHLREHRGDVDDLAGLLGDQVRRGGPAAVEGADQVDLEDSPEVLGRHLGERSHPRDPRVVDDDVKPPQLGHGALHERLHLRVGGHVGDDREGPATGRGDQAGGLVEIGLRARGERHVGPGPRERDRHRSSQAPAGAGDDGHAAVEPHRREGAAIGRGNRAAPDACR